MEQTITANTEEGIDIVPVSDVEKRATEAGLPESQATAVADAYGDAQLAALRKSLGAVAALALLSLWFTRRLPGSAVTPTQPAATATSAA